MDLPRIHASGYGAFRRRRKVKRHQIKEIRWQKMLAERDERGRFRSVYIRLCGTCDWPLHPVVKIV